MLYAVREGRDKVLRGVIEEQLADLCQGNDD